MSDNPERTLTRMVRRHNALVTHLKVLEKEIKELPPGQEPPALDWLTDVANAALQSNTLPAKVAETLRAALPITMESLTTDNGDLEKALGQALKVAIRQINLPPIPPPWGPLIQALLKLIGPWGAQFLMWVLIKVIVAGTKQARAKVMTNRLQVVRTRIAVLAKSLGVTVETEADGTLYVAIVDDDDDDVVAELPSAVM